MIDIPQYIKEFQLKLWLAKTPEEKLLQFLMDNDAMLKASRQAKQELGIPLGDLDPIRGTWKIFRMPESKLNDSLLQHYFPVILRIIKS
jgi:hypothetical protein